MGGEWSLLPVPPSGWPPCCYPADPCTLLQAAVKHLLPEIKPQDASKLCVVIDLDETLVHSSFKVGDTLAHPTPLATCSPTCSATPFPQSDAQHPAQPGWLRWGVPVRGLRGWQGCIVGRQQPAFGQGVPGVPSADPGVPFPSR